MQPRGDGSFQVLARINGNAHKLDLSGEYNISAIFNVSDLSPFDVGDDSRTNPFKEGGTGMMRSKGTSVHLRILYTFEEGQLQGYVLKGCNKH